jgi:hypothetical protein
MKGNFRLSSPLGSARRSMVVKDDDRKERSEQVVCTDKLNGLALPGLAPGRLRSSGIVH